LHQSPQRIYGILTVVRRAMAGIFKKHGTVNQTSWLLRYCDPDRNFECLLWVISGHLVLREKESLLTLKADILGRLK
jgi:hypothetical protein